MRASKAGRQGHPLAAKILGGALALLAALPLMAACARRSAPASPLPPPVDADASANPLIELLSFVPNTPEHRDLLTWGDAAAWYEATGLPRVASMAEATALPEEQWNQLRFGLFGLLRPPEALGAQYLYAEDLRAQYGFDLFSADQMLNAGMDIDSLTVVTVNSDPAAIDTALSRTGYTATQVSGGVLYSLRGDYEIDLEDESIGRTGTLNRIALVEGDNGSTLVISKATAPVEAALAAHSAASPALADDPLYRFVAESLTDGTFDYLGELVGLIFVQPQPGGPTAVLGMMGPEIQAQLEAYQREPMPPILLHALAAFRDGAETVFMLVSVLPADTPADQAEEAAVFLYDRLDGDINRTSSTLEDSFWAREAYGTLIGDTARAAYVTMRLTDASED